MVSCFYLTERGMKKAFGEYRRLARGAFSCSSLWAGEEHLLYVQGTGFLVPMSEDYRRVRYRDVQAVTLVKTKAALVMILISSLLLLLFGVPAVLGVITLLDLTPGVVGEEAFALVSSIGGGSIALVALALLVWNLARGRSCKLGVQTANGTVVVRAANRVKIAKRLVEELAPLIEAKQGVEPPGETEEAG